MIRTAGLPLTQADVAQCPRRESMTSRDVAEAHRGAVAVGDDEGRYSSAFEELIVGGDMLSALAVRRTSPLGRLALAAAERGAHVFEADAVAC